MLQRVFLWLLRRSTFSKYCSHARQVKEYDDSTKVTLQPVTTPGLMQCTLNYCIRGTLTTQTLCGSILPDKVVQPAVSKKNHVCLAVLAQLYDNLLFVWRLQKRKTVFKQTKDTNSESALAVGECALDITKCVCVQSWCANILLLLVWSHQKGCAIARVISSSIEEIRFNVPLPRRESRWHSKVVALTQYRT